MIDPIPNPQTEQHRLIVRLVSSAWHDNRGLHIRQDILFLRRKSCGHNFVDEDCTMVGADQVAVRITNLSECRDGVYQVVTCNEKRDLESEVSEEYDYKLIPFDEHKTNP